MPGWDSLQAVTWMHDSVQLLGLILILLLAAAAAGAYFHLARTPWPEAIEVPGLPLRTPWFTIGRLRLRSRWLESSAAIAVALLIVAEIAAYGFGHRKDALLALAAQGRSDQVETQLAIFQRQAKQIAELQRLEKQVESQRAAEQTHATAEIARLKKSLSDAEGKIAELQRARRTVDTTRSAAELVRLQQALTDAEQKVAALQRTHGQRRLTVEEKQTLIAALKPFAGQHVTIASILGDEDANNLAEDFVAVFDAAGWKHGGAAGVTVRQWDRDPVGVEVTLNEADARAGRISAGAGALINVVRKLGLALDNTIYMSSEVPAGQVLLKVGKKLRK